MACLAGRRISARSSACPSSRRQPSTGHLSPITSILTRSALVTSYCALRASDQQPAFAPLRSKTRTASRATCGRRQAPRGGRPRRFLLTPGSVEPSSRSPGADRSGNSPTAGSTSTAVTGHSCSRSRPASGSPSFSLTFPAKTPGSVEPSSRSPGADRSGNSPTAGSTSTAVTGHSCSRSRPASGSRSRPARIGGRPRGRPRQPVPPTKEQREHRDMIAMRSKTHRGRHGGDDRLLVENSAGTISMGDTPRRGARTS